MIVGFNLILVFLFVLVSYPRNAILQSKVKEGAKNKKIIMEPIEMVEVNELDKLPDEFTTSKLPFEDKVGVGEKIKFDYIGVIDMLVERDPDNPFSIDTQFHVYRRENKAVIPFKLFKNCIKKPQEQQQCKTLPVDLNKMLQIFDLNKRTLIIIGGFLTAAPSDWQLKIVEHWLKLEDINIIVVSWNKGNRFLYPKAVANTKVVARQVVILLYYLAHLNGLDLAEKTFTDNIMIVGHSLGAHIAGFIGQDFAGQIGRITGLDPAGPLFTMSHEYHRLDRNDALLVDVIHTNADHGFNYYLGLFKPVGHVDYYANDGKWQPNCNLSNFFECNHGAVISYYISILEHELSMRDVENSRDDYRIVAYRASTYEQFRTGASLHQHCPKLAEDGYETRMQTGADDFYNCAIPMDFLKKARDFRQELEQVYKINFEPDYVTEAKFFFFTSAKQPYIVDHNILKLHYEVSHMKAFDARQPAIKLVYTMFDNEKSEVRVPMLGEALSPNENDLHPHASIPFVVTSHFGRYMLIDLELNNFFVGDNDDSTALTQSDEHTRRRAMENSILSHVYKIFPTKIELNIEGVKRYIIKTARVQPFRNTNRLFMAVYNTFISDPKEQPKPKIIFLKDGEPVPNIGATFQGGTENPKLYLYAIIIGPDTSSGRRTQQDPSSKKNILTNIFEQDRRSTEIINKEKNDKSLGARILRDVLLASME